jgi:hypothetical protein
MKKHSTYLVLIFSVMVLLTITSQAQQPAPSPSPTGDGTVTETPDGLGRYDVVSSIEFGYRGITVDGDHKKYQSDLNYKAGPRIFDSSFLMRSRNGGGDLFNTLLVTSTGWGADPQGTLRISAENPKWFRFDGFYRRFKYFRYLNTFANPNWVFNPTTFSVPPKLDTGEHGTDARMKLGDFDVTILPKNRKIRFNVGYSPERLNGPQFTNYHVGGNEFNLVNNLRSHANDYRFGADGTIGFLDYSFLQGFRRFRDDSFINQASPPINLNPSAASLTTYHRDEPSRGEVNYTRLSLHSLVAQKLDITARVIYSKASQSYDFIENFTGRNWNPRITGWPPGPLAATPNILNLGQYNISGETERPNTVGDIGITYLATEKLRISNTFRVEDFKINGDAVFADFFSITRGSGSSLRTDSLGFSNLDAHTHTSYRKYQNTFEGDYQFNSRYSIHLGYRYGNRQAEETFEGFNFGSNGSLSPPPARSSSFESEENHTHAILGGFKARPATNWTLYFDAEHGTADNVFFRIGNYDYTNIRAKSRYAPKKNLVFNLAVISKNNANPSEIAGVSLQDFGVSTRSRIFTSSIDWTANSNISFNTGYNYNWVNSNAVVEYFFNSIGHPFGRSLNYIRNHYFFFDTVARLHPRATLYAAYRINKDTGQGSRVANPTGNPGFLIASYPMSFQTPEARLAFKVSRWLDWNVGYQYYNYEESTLVGPRPQNYHSHMPYTSLRFYFGRKE